MGFRCLSPSIIRAFSGAGLTTFALHAFAQPSNQRPVSQVQSQTPSATDAPDPSIIEMMPHDSCTSQPSLNVCKPHQPMRALTPREIELVMGSNSMTSSSQPGSHGSCNANSCNTTSNLPPSSQPHSSIPPPSSPPPDSSPPPSGGGGGGGSPAVPSAQQQTHLENCAKIYGNISPKSGFLTNFTSEYGWSSDSSVGLPLKHLITATDTPPPASEIPPGGGDWLIIGASTYIDKTPLRTDIYMASYTTDADMVKTLSHEWYHQNHDIVGESDAVRSANEAAAQALGVQAETAYKSDNGKKCAGQ